MKCQARMTFRVDVKPQLLTWAIERSGLEPSALHHKFKKLDEWQEGATKPTFKQLDAFAKATFTPFGYLLSNEPPEEPMPIPDFRTLGGAIPSKISLNLRETIYICQQRQFWYHDYLRNQGFDALPFPGSVALDHSPADVATQIRDQIQFNVHDRESIQTWEGALSRLIDLVEEAEIMVMRSSIVKNNTRRKLDPTEFRGFALNDNYAPAIFINGADSKSAQMFTLAHELAHIWLGESGLSNPALLDDDTQEIEKWCNAVAAELLVPMDEFNTVADRTKGRFVETMVKHFKVSSLVILRRMYDGGKISRGSFLKQYDAEAARFKDSMKSGKGGGGDFYRTQLARSSKLFTRAIIANALEGQTSFRDAMNLTGLKKMSSFDAMGRRLGVIN